MWFAADLEEELTSEELDVLSAAFDLVDDQLFTELVDLSDATSDPADRSITARAFSDLHLPLRYSDSYDIGLLRRLAVCLVCVADRISEPLQPLRCRGEELVLRAVIEMAITEWDASGNPADHSFERLLDLCFSDLDHEYMFDPAFDGIDDPNTHEGSQLGIRSLHPTTWFEPLIPELRVHPLAAMLTTQLQRRGRAGSTASRMEHGSPEKLGGVAGSAGKPCRSQPPPSALDA